MALRRGADAICEKPLVLNPWNLNALQKMEIESGQRIWNVLQLRLHDSIIEFEALISCINCMFKLLLRNCLYALITPNSRNV